MQTFPEILQHSYGKTVALAAALISAIGYMGFTASQVLAGAKLTSATFVGVDIPEAVIIMGAIAVVYTALGGIYAGLLLKRVPRCPISIKRLFSKSGKTRKFGQPKTIKRENKLFSPDRPPVYSAAGREFLPTIGGHHSTRRLLRNHTHSLCGQQHYLWYGH